MVYKVRCFSYYIEHKKIQGKNNIKFTLNPTAVVRILWLLALNIVDRGVLGKSNINTLSISHSGDLHRDKFL